MGNQNKRKIIIVTAILVLCIAGFLCFAFVMTPRESKSQAKSNAIINKAAAAQLNKYPDEMTDSDYAQVMKLLIMGQEFCDIKLLEKFTNLEKLELRCIGFPEENIPSWVNLLDKIGIVNRNEQCTIDLSPLKKLTKLQILVLSGNYFYIGDGDYLKMVQPVKKYVRNNAPFRNIKPLSSLVNLKELDLSGSLVRDLTPIKKLKNLQSLNLENCKNITDKQVEDLQKSLPDLEISK